MGPKEQLGSAGDLSPSQDSEEIAEVFAESEEQPAVAVAPPVDEGGEGEGSNTDTVEDVLRELQRENDRLRQPEEAASCFSPTAGGAPADGVSDVIATSDAELLQQLEKENFELLLTRDAGQSQVLGGEQSVLIASLLAIVAKLEEDTRTTTVKTAPDAVPVPANAATAGDVSPRAQRPRSARRVRPGGLSLGSPIPLSNWSGAGGGVRRRSPQSHRHRAPSPSGAGGEMARVNDDERESSTQRRTGSSRRRSRRDRSRSTHVKPLSGAAAAANSAAASRRVARRRKNDWLAWPEAGGGALAGSAQLTTSAGDSGVLIVGGISGVASSLLVPPGDLSAISLQSTPPRKQEGTHRETHTARQRTRGALEKGKANGFTSSSFEQLTNEFRAAVAQNLLAPTDRDRMAAELVSLAHPTTTTTTTHPPTHPAHTSLTISV